MNYRAIKNSEWEASDHISRTIQLLRRNEWHELTPFVLDGNQLGVTYKSEEILLRIIQSLYECTCLKQVSFQNAILGLKSQSALSELLHHNTGITSITLRNLKGDDDRCLLPIPASFFHYASNLHSLTLDRCRLDEVSAYEFGQLLYKPNCTVQKLSLNQLTLCCSDGWTVFTEAIGQNNSLSTFSMTNSSHLQLSKTVRLVQGLGRNQSIRTLVFENMNIDSHHASYIRDILLHNNTLQSLSLRHNNLSANDIAIVMNSMNDNPTMSIQSLFLSENPIGSNGVESIVKYLQNRNCTIQYLCLEHCEIWHDGCQQLANGLATFQSLVGLYLDGNEIERCGLELLCSLRKNTTIREVLHVLPTKSAMGKYHMSKQDYDCWLTIDFYLRANHANRKEVLHAISSNDGDVPILSKCLPALLSKQCNLAGTDVIYYFLRSMP